MKEKESTSIVNFYPHRQYIANTTKKWINPTNTAI